MRLQSTESTRALSSSLKVVSSKYSRVEPRITARREPAMTKAQLVHRQPSQRQQRRVNRPTRSVSFVYRPSRLVPPDLGLLLEEEKEEEEDLPLKQYSSTILLNVSVLFVCWPRRSFEFGDWFFSESGPVSDHRSPEALVLCKIRGHGPSFTYPLVPWLL